MAMVIVAVTMIVAVCCSSDNRLLVLDKLFPTKSSLH